MEKLCDRNRCTGCGACAAVCPRNCIAMEPDAEGFLHPVIREENCVHCGLCSRTCPVLSEIAVAGTPAAYAAIHSDEKIRRESTSGGVFTLLCRWVLERQGVIFGAAYGEDFSVEHRMITRLEDLSALRGTKYAQSRLGESYRQVRSCLETGQYVLFSGTPCQVGGLLTFLGKRYDRLILVDLICHGVPSPKVWQHYIRYRGRVDAEGEAPVRINLRSKETGWPGYSIRFDYPGEKSYSSPNSKDPYLRGFVGNLYLRRSCYNCQYKGTARQSDFTLGDYWGVWSQLPEFHDQKGTSLVLLHTEKAKAIWQELAGEMRCAEVSAAAALTDNPSAVVSSPLPDNRAAFFARYEKEDFHGLINERCPMPDPPKKTGLFRRAARKIRRIWKR